MVDLHAHCRSYAMAFFPSLSIPQILNKLHHEVLVTNPTLGTFFIKNQKIYHSNIQNICPNSQRPSLCCCMHCILSRHLVNNIHSYFVLVVEVDNSQFFFSCICDWAIVHCGYKNYIFMFFALIVYKCTTFRSIVKKIYCKTFLLCL